jgi:hypothetical protein
VVRRQPDVPGGRKIGTLNIIDDYNPEALSMEGSFSFPAEPFIQVLSQCIEWRESQPESGQTSALSS